MSATETITLTCIHTVTVPDSDTNGTQRLVLQTTPVSEPGPSNNTRRVTFTPDTIDNEHLGRLKSNCCCIYVKPRKWDDPDTWEQDEHETEHCRGHTIAVDPAKKRGDNADGHPVH